MDSTLTTRDGVSLHVRDWDAAGASHGAVVLVHGLGEHIGRYEHVAGRLAGAGWRVTGHDHRGHGRSGGARGALAHADDYLDDLARVVDLARSRGRGPLVLLGHSLGGLVASRFVLGTPGAAWMREVDALVMSSPALDLGMSGAQKALLALLGPVAPNLAVGNGLKPEWISHDRAVVQAYRDDPLVHDRVTPRVVRFLLDGGEAVRAAASLWTVPTLLMWAGADRCVAPRGSAEFVAAAPAGRVLGREFASLYHEIFNEPEQGQVFGVLLDWLSHFARAARTLEHA